MAQPPDRIQIQRAGPPVLLQPQARPVDTYVAPGPSRLRGLAEGLRSLEGGLDALLRSQDAGKAKRDEDEELRGQAAAFEANNADGFDEALKQGLIPAHYSPAFQKGYKTATGIVGGNQMQAEFDAAFEAWEGKNQDDPEAYDTFVGDFIRKSIKTDDPDVLRGLLPQVRELHSRGYAKYTAYRHEQTYNGSMQAHAAGISQEIDAATKDGLSEVEGTDYPALYSRIEAWRQGFLASGGKETDADKLTIDAITAKALQLQDPGILKFFNEKVPGKDYTYGDTQYGLNARQTAVDALEVIERRQASEGRVAQEREDKVRGDAARSAIIDYLVKEGVGAVIPDDLMATAKKYDDTIVVKVEEWRQNLNRGVTEVDALNRVYDDIMKGGGMRAVVAAQDAGVFGRKEDLTAAYDFASKWESANGGGKIEDALGSDIAKQFFKDIDIRTKGKGELGDPISGTSKEGYEAQYDFTRMVTEWIIANPDANWMERQQKITEIGKAVMDRITTTDPMDPEPGTYNRPTQAPFPNPFTGGITVGEPAAEPQAMEPVTPVNPSMDEEVANFLENMAENPGQREQFDAMAKSQGMTPEEAARIILEPQAQPNVAPEEPSSGGVLPFSPISYRPGAEAAPRPPAAGRGLGMMALVASNKRGYTPDLKNLRPEMVDGVTELQAAFGAELPIVSGFRGAARNKKAGGAKGSQHKHGNAVDIDVSSMSKAERLRLIQMASEQGFTGIGVYTNSIHLDYGGRRAWGPTHGKESVPGWAREAIAEHVGRVGASKPLRDKYGPMTREQAMAYLDEALTADLADLDFEGSASVPGDPQAAQLLNLIGQHEGGGNYNAVHGNAGSTRDLGAMTLDSIMATQRAAMARGVASTAVGKYQFLNKTLRGLKAELGLTGKEPFNKALQDRLATALLYRRGYKQYKEGKLSARQFAFRLSQEWAALPNPQTGRSYYAGDGLNISSVKVGQVYSALGII